MARGLALLPALCLFISVLALEVEARFLPDMNDCGPLQKHRYRCDPPLTRSIQGDDSGQLTPTDMSHDTSSTQEEGRFHLAPTKISSAGVAGQTQGVANSSISGAAHEQMEDGVEVAATPPPSLTPTPEGLNSTNDPQCGPLQKHRYRCNPPLIEIRDP